MKNFLKYSLLIFGVYLLGACDAFELEGFLDNPNEVTPESAELNLVYNNVMYNMGRFLDEASDETMPYVRMVAMTGGNQYQNQDAPTSFDFIWGLAYSTLLPDIDLVIDIASPEDGVQLTFFRGTAKVMKAMIMMTMVDLFGDIPFSESGQGAAVQNPVADDDASIYAACLTLLNEAVADLGTASTLPDNDLFYDGDREGWLKAANSLIIKYHVTTRLAGGSGSEISSIISGGNYISDVADDFDFHYGSNRNNPDSRHPYYGDGYEDGGPGWYMSNYYMWSFFGDKENEDPRLRYYFYRQDCNETDEDQFTIDCPAAPYPSHWPNGLPFCTASLEYGDPNDEYGGYWGRDHGDDSGIPPDDLKRTAWGLYPAAGKFDNDDCSQVSNLGTDGAGGAGIQPVMHASYVDFLIAEAILTMGVSGDARAHLEDGVRKSISKVMAFAGGATDPAFEPSSDQVDAYVNEVLDRYDAADDAGKLNVVITEYWLAAHGNGRDAYNNYRRTGYPADMQPTLEIDPGEFARSFWYPADFVNLNSSITSNKVITDQVFWDTNPAGFIK